MTTYSDRANQTASEKIVLATLKAVKQYKIFTLHSGSVYYKDVDYFVSNVKQSATDLVEFTSSSLSAGQFYFDKTAKRLYVRTTDSTNPNTKDIIVFHKFFYSNKPLILPCDLLTGEDVEWDGRIISGGNISQSLDDENTGISIETSTNLKLMNGDGYFDEIFDQLVWENKEVEIYSWFYDLPITEKRKIFSGVIIDKSFNPSDVTFKVKDFTFKLRDFLNLARFSTADGTISDDTLGTPKRRIFGRAKSVKCVGVDKLLEGLETSRTLSGNAGDNFITALNSINGFLYQGDQFLVELPNGEFLEFTADSVTSSTNINIGDELEDSFYGAVMWLKQNNGWKSANRDWHIAGHKLLEKSYNIDQVISQRRFVLDSVDGLVIGDRVKINSDYVNIVNISGNTVVTEFAISPAPVVNDNLDKIPIQKVHYGDIELVPVRDYTYTNTTEAILTLTSTAEFNIAKTRTLGGVTLTFTNGSGTVNRATGTVDLQTIIKAKDRIRIDDVNHITWYEVRSVSETQILLTSAFGYTTAAYSALYKNVDLVKDDSLITVDTYGLMNGTDWIYSASQCVQYILENDAAITSIDQTAFDKAHDQADFSLSLVLPESVGEGLPSIRTTISKINSSVFGSLSTNNDFDLSYKILNSSKPTSLVALKDDDIISFSVDSTNSVISDVVVKYRPFTDITTGENAFEQVTFSNDFVENVVETSNTIERIIYVYDDAVAETIAQRICFFKSMVNQKVKVKGKMNLALLSLNDIVYIDLDRLYKRYGGGDRLKIGAVSSITNNIYDVEITFNDFGNVFNRVPAICENTQAIYSAATRDEVSRYGFILDNTLFVPDTSSEAELGNNLIG